MKKERFVLVERGQLTAEKNILQQWHPLDDKRGFIAVSDLPQMESTPVFYYPVSFPESQLFMDGHQHEIHLINDEKGREKYGNAAYFVEESLYQKVRAGFEKEVAAFSHSTGRQR